MVLVAEGEEMKIVCMYTKAKLPKRLVQVTAINKLNVKLGQLYDVRILHKPIHFWTWLITFKKYVHEILELFTILGLI